MSTVSRETLEILLVQIRDHGAVREEEIESFCRHGRLRRDQLTVLNVFDEVVFPPGRADGFDAVLVGGASEASVMEPERYPFVPHIIRLLHHCIALKTPVFASCFGFQAAVKGLGGHLKRDEEGFEMGTIPLHLTEEAATDPVFRGIPDGFLGVSCHQERALKAPPGTILLAFTDQCCHSFRVKDRPFWTFQFHPELDRQRFEERLGIFRSKYTDTNAHYNDTVSQFQETPHSNQLLRAFIDRVVVEGVR